MNTPPLLLGATLLFWGWQAGHPLLAAVMAVALELPRLVKARWEFTDEELNQLWDFCVLLFFAVAVYAFAANEGTAAVRGFMQAQSFGERSNAMNKGALAAQVFIQWLPFVFFPFVVAQAYSQRPDVPASAFSLWLRRQRRREAQAGRTLPPDRRLNVAYPYLGVCVFGACAVQAGSPWFYPALCCVLAWTLWGQRNPRFAAPVWAGAVLLAAGLGFAGGRGLQALQGLLENLPAGWVARLTRRSAEARENRTALGEIGRIKLSGRIVLRLLGNPGEVPPPLLRESSYNVFHSPIWLGTPSSFEPTAPETNGTSWLLAPAGVANQAVTIAGYLKGGHGILALPGGTARIDDMPAAELHTNRLGAVLAREGPGLAIYSARYAADRTLDGPPLPEDRTVPGAETTALARVAAELHLPAPTLNETVNRVSSFFQNSFTYRLWLPGLQRGATNETALARFLLRDRAGHCEFFATATTLLLRQLGVPARYSVGYSVQERSGRNRYVIRERHAHSWCVYYDEAARVWKDLDTTPASWSATEGALARFWEPLTDAWSRVWFEFQKLRWGQSGFRR